MILERVIAIGLVVAIVFTALAQGTVEPWSVALFELLILALVLLWAVEAAIAGRMKLYVPNIALPLGGLLLVGIIQGIAIGDPVKSLSLDVEATRGATLMILTMFAAVLLAANSPFKPRRLYRLAWFFVGYGLLLALFALIQYYTWNGRFFWLRPMAESPSPFGPFVNHNHFAGYMELLFPISVGLLVVRIAKGPARLMLVFAAFMMAVAAIVSLSRGGMIGLAAGMVALASMGFATGRGRRARFHESRDEGELEYAEPRLSSMVSPAVIVIGLVALIGLGLFWIGPEKVVERVAQGKITTADPDQESFFSSRGWIWKDTLRIFEAHPVMGAGLGTFASVYAIYSLRDGLMPATRAHNDYLQILAESGIIGGVLVVWFIVLAARNTYYALRSRDRLAVGLAIGSAAALVSLMVHSILDFNLQIPSNALLFLLLATLLACLAQSTRMSSREPGSLKGVPEQRVIADEVTPRVLAS